MEKSCETCRYDLGGGRYNCRLNVEQECRDGEGYELWEPNDKYKPPRPKKVLIDEIELLERLDMLRKTLYTIGGDNCERRAAGVAEAIREVNAMPPEWIGMTWVSVDRKMKPMKDEEVLVVTKTKKGFRAVDKGYYDHESARWVHRGVSEVTHWMQMPELPVEGD